MQTATRPFATRAISATPAGASSMNATTSCASATSKEPSSHGSCSAAPSRTSRSGKRRRSDSANAGAGSIADGRAPRRTSSCVSIPVPAPTSRTRSPAVTPAKSAKTGASRDEKRPMKLSYAASELHISGSIHVEEKRRVKLDLDGIEAGEHGAQAPLLGFEGRQSCASDRARERAVLCDRSVATGCRELVRRGPQSGRNRGDRAGARIVDTAGANPDPFGARLAEQPPGAVAERLTVVLRQLLRRPEARARPAREQDPRQAVMRHGSV